MLGKIKIVTIVAIGIIAVVAAILAILAIWGAGLFGLACLWDTIFPASSFPSLNLYGNAQTLDWFLLTYCILSFLVFILVSNYINLFKSRETKKITIKGFFTDIRQALEETFKNINDFLKGIFFIVLVLAAIGILILIAIYFPILLILIALFFLWLAWIRSYS